MSQSVLPDTLYDCEQKERDVIAVRDVSRHYQQASQNIQALRSVGFSLREGTFAALMGPSGSGKSTLLNIISGLDQPNSGEVEVFGSNLSEMTQRELSHWRSHRVGLIFQSFNLIPVLTAVENVALPLVLHKISRPEQLKRAELALDLVNLSDRRHHTPQKLSGGEQQRVAIARALVTDPVLLVADEPTGELDAENAESILSLLKLMKDRLGKTVLMVTHDPRAVDFVDLVLRLDKGRLVDSPRGVGRPEAPRSVSDEKLAARI